MPVRQGEDERGPYYQWGSGTKYYYKPSSPRSREDAKKKAGKQGEAAYAAGYRGSKEDVGREEEGGG